MSEYSPSRAVIDLDAYAHNLGVVREQIGPDTGIIAVVKADGYGHGLVPIARRAVAEGVSILGVACVDEGVALRNAGIDAPILVMLHPQLGALDELVEHKLSLLISNVAMAEAVNDAARAANTIANVHCKIDTGMGRQGFSADEALDAIRYIAKLEHVCVDGLATHFPTANYPGDAYTAEQIAAFGKLVNAVTASGIEPRFVHAANSAAVVNHHDSLFNCVRIGLMTYGVWPSNAPRPDDLLAPVLRWEAKVVMVRDFPAGGSIGYERSYTPDTPMRGALIPVGYADGYRIALSNRADVLIHGARCPVRGNVSMDQIVVDVSHLDNVQPGDEAVLIGAQNAEQITTEELAALAHTIPYEILTGIGLRVPRVYTGEEAAAKTVRAAAEKQ